MARMTPVGAKKRKVEEAMRGQTSKPRKRIRKQKRYHSSSEDEGEEQADIGFAPVNLGDSDEEIVEPAAGKKQKRERIVNAESLSTNGTTSKKSKCKQPVEEPSSEDEIEEGGDLSQHEADAMEQDDIQDDGPNEASAAAVIAAAMSDDAANIPSDSEPEGDSGSDASSDSDNDSDPQSTNRLPKQKSKRNDPTAFSTSISKILSTKLPTSKRADPVLSRSIDAAKQRASKSNDKLDLKAKQKLRADKQVAMQKGRTTDVLGVERGITGDVAEKEKALRKIATRGVIQLFNAFRGAHERAEEAKREERKRGTVGMGERDRKAGEVGKESFLELIGGKKKKGVET